MMPLRFAPPSRAFLRDGITLDEMSKSPGERRMHVHVLFWIRRVDDDSIFALLIGHKVCVVVAATLPYFQLDAARSNELSLLHIGMDSICILRVRLGFAFRKSAIRYQEKKATPTVMTIDVIGRLNVCFATARKLMENVVALV